MLLMLAALSVDTAAVLPEEKKKPAAKPPPAPADTRVHATAGKTFTWTADGQEDFQWNACKTVATKSNTYVFDSSGKQARRTSTGTNTGVMFDESIGKTVADLSEAESNLSDARKKRNPYSGEKARARWDSERPQVIADLSSRVDELRKRHSDERAACQAFKGQTWRTVYSVTYDPTENKTVEIKIEDTDNDVGARTNSSIEVIEGGKFLRVINQISDNNPPAARLYRAQ